MNTHRMARSWLAAVPVAGLMAVSLCQNPDPTPTSRADSYVDTPGANTDRPGKHSTTTGRHGTAGEVGGGIDSQSGHDEPDDLDRRQEEKAGAR